MEMYRAIVTIFDKIRMIRKEVHLRQVIEIDGKFDIMLWVDADLMTII